MDDNQFEILRYKIVGAVILATVVALVTLICICTWIGAQDDQRMGELGYVRDTVRGQAGLQWVKGP